MNTLHMCVCFLYMKHHWQCLHLWMVICSNCCLKMQKAKWHHRPLYVISSHWGLSVGPLCLFTSVSLWEKRHCKTLVGSQLLSGGVVASSPLLLPAMQKATKPETGLWGQDLSLLPFGSPLFLGNCARCLYMLLAVEVSSKLHKKSK